MAKKELIKIIDGDIMYYMQRIIDLLDINKKDLRVDYAEKIQGMLLIAMDTRLIDYDGWVNCMNCIYNLVY